MKRKNVFSCARVGRASRAARRKGLKVNGRCYGNVCVMSKYVEQTLRVFLRLRHLIQSCIFTLVIFTLDMTSIRRALGQYADFAVLGGDKRHDETKKVLENTPRSVEDGNVRGERAPPWTCNFGWGGFCTRPKFWMKLVNRGCTTELDEERDKLIGVIGVSSIFTAADCSCDAGVELLPYARVASRLGLARLGGISSFLMMIYSSKRLYFFMLSDKVWARRSRSARRSS